MLNWVSSSQQQNLVNHKNLVNMVHVSDNVVKAVRNINILNIQKDTLETLILCFPNIFDQKKKLTFFFPQKRLYLYFTRLVLTSKLN